MKETTTESNFRLVTKIKASTLYQSYEKAFETVTGLSLLLQPAHGAGINGIDCAHSQTAILGDSRAEAGSAQCSAGLEESAVPIRFGEETVAYLRTGQVMHSPPRTGAREGLGRDLNENGPGAGEIREGRRLHRETKVEPKKDLQHATVLLAIFSLQLSNLINQLVLAKNADEPLLVDKAKRTIRERLAERLSLEEVAAGVGVSSFYFCKLFKQSTGMTFTEYVNRKRVEWAKAALLKPSARVTEVAFAVGYQSLSQFNRSFLKYAGEAPTQYRKRMQRAPGQGAEILAS